MAALLARSDPLPFSYTWPGAGPSSSAGMPADTLAVVARNMHRFRALHIARLRSDELTGLLAQPAQQCSRGSRLKRLMLEAAAGFDAALQLFCLAAGGPWRLELNREKETGRGGQAIIEFLSDSGDVPYTVRCNRAISLPQVLIHFTRDDEDEDASGDEGAPQPLHLLAPIIAPLLDTVTVWIRKTLL
ncbi:hypothetical protein AURDEDRAFT_170671 [Auricularia subglabra TFB-10046 SS5]|nr:hypothetical protein AURDEDRAFT_170671 [Auricularia subglabra TFB-10046 SS5]